MNRALCVALLTVAPWAAEAQLYQTQPENMEQALAAIEMRDQVDRFLNLRSLLDRALDVERADHHSSARSALEALGAYLTGFHDSFRADGPTGLHPQDRIDSALIEVSAENYRWMLTQSLADGDELRQWLPVADLMESLPDLTGLLDSNAVAVARDALIKARQQVPAPWAVMEWPTSLGQARDLAGRARELDGDLESWKSRIDRRFSIEAAADLHGHVDAVRAGLNVFREKLESDVLPGLEDSNEAWGEPVGRDRFVGLLQRRHMIELTPEDLLGLGRRSLDSLHEEIDVVASRIDGSKSTDEVWDMLKDRRPTADELPRFAFDEMQRSLEHLLESGIVTVPEDARRNVMLLTEGRTFDTYPFGGYGGSERQGRERVGRFLTSPPPPDLDSAVSEARLRGNNYYWARVVAVHEIYPGHHLQRVVAEDIARPMRRAFYTTTLGEGWGLYSEQLMYRTGFFQDNETLMAMLMMRAWRAARIVIDVSLHLGLMSFDEAVAFLVENVDMDEPNAIAEVRRYMGNPTRPLSYMFGYLQIEALRAEVMAIMGEEYSEREFHDALLAYGAIPFPLIRYGMLSGIGSADPSALH